MDSSLICWDCSSMADSLPRLTTCSLVTMLTEANSHWRLSSCSLPIKQSSKRISSYYAATTSVDKSIVSMASTMSAREDIVSVSGRSSRTCSTACRLQHSSTTRSSACMVDFHRNSSLWHNCSKLLDLPKYLRMDFFATCCGLIRKSPRVAGERTTEVSAIHLEKPSSSSFWRRMTLIWFAELIKWLRTAMSSSAADSSSLYFQRLTTVENSIIPALWCLSTTHWCAASLFWRLLMERPALELDQEDPRLHQASEERNREIFVLILKLKL